MDNWYGYVDWWVKAAIRGELDQQAVAPAQAALGVASVVVEPVDWAMTGAACLSGDCNVPMVLAAALPGVSGAVGRHGDDVVGAVKALNGSTAQGVSTVADDAEGAFSIVDWTGYPSDVPRPRGPFRLLEGAEYNTALAAKNNANKALRRAADPPLGGAEIHGDSAGQTWR